MRQSCLTSCLAILVAIAVISPIGPTSFAQSSKIQAQVKFEAANLAIEEKQYDEALTLLEEAIQLADSNTDFLYAAAQCSFEIKNYSKAQTYILQTLKTYSKQSQNTPAYQTALQLAARIERYKNSQKNVEPLKAVTGGTGRKLTTTLCVACHTLGRVVSARRTAEGWQNTITNHNLPKGQISKNEIKIIVSYLAVQFGKEPKTQDAQINVQGSWQFSFQGSSQQLYFPFNTKYECEEARSQGLKNTQDTLSKYQEGTGDEQTKSRVIQLQRALNTTSPCHPVQP